MKKSSFVALVLGTVSGMLFALGMCMVLLPEWNAFKPGVIFGTVGLIMGLITIAVWRKMEGKKPIKVSGKSVLAILVGIIGAIMLGIGMCFCMVWNKMVLGIIIGIVGIVILLSMIPLTKGFKD
ncbi:MAG: hypothetical protein Q4B31_03310 [Clostridia bacterium]|nr:hypothetical protein [Clostridia bacterium]